LTQEVHQTEGRCQELLNMLERGGIDVRCLNDMDCCFGSGCTSVSTSTYSSYMEPACESKVERYVAPSPRLGALHSDSLIDDHTDSKCWQQKMRRQYRMEVLRCKRSKKVIPTRIDFSYASSPAPFLDDASMS